MVHSADGSACCGVVLGEALRQAGSPTLQGSWRVGKLALAKSVVEESDGYANRRIHLAASPCSCGCILANF